MTEIAAIEAELKKMKGSRGRQMIVERLGRIRGEPSTLSALRRLATDPDVALHAQAGLRRQLGDEEAVEFIQPLLSHEFDGVRRGATYNLKMAERALRRRARTQSRWPPA